MSGSAAEDATAALRRALRRGGANFTFLPIEVEGPRRAELIQALRSWSGREGIPTLKVLPFGHAGVEAIEQLVRGTLGTRDGVVVPDGDALVHHEGGRVVEGLNLARDLLPRHVHGPLVVLCTPDAMAAFAAAAPDLFSVRSSAMHLAAGERPEGGPDLPLRIEPTDALMPMRESLSAIEAEAIRLQELTASGGAPPPGTLVDAWLLLAKRLGRISATTHAEDLRCLALMQRCLDTAENLAEAAGYRRGVADALEAKAAYGRFLSMLDRRTAIERAIAIYNELALRREAASAMGSFGQLLFEQFERHEEGIALLRQAVARLDQSGDEPWRGDLASFLARYLMGVNRLDEAIAVLRHDALTAYEQTSDTRDVLKTRSFMAHLEGMRGNTVAAMESMEREVLPAVRAFADERLLAEALIDAADVHLLAGNLLGRQRGIRLLEEARLVATRCGHGRVMTAIRALEQRHGLRPVSHAPAPQNRRERRAQSRRSSVR